MVVFYAFLILKYSVNQLERVIMGFLGYSNTSLKWMPYLYLKFDSIFKVSKYWTQSKNSMWIFWFFISIKNQEKPPDVLYFRLCICVYFFIGLDCYSLPDKHWSYCPWKHRQCVVWALQCLTSCSWLDLQLYVGSTYKSIWEDTWPHSHCYILQGISYTNYHPVKKCG